MTVPIIRKLDTLRALTGAWKAAGETIGVVPTMGALHDGHLSLAEAARSDCDRVIVTIFVNPKQFNNARDLASYPRTEHQDAEKLAPYGIDAIWAPDPDQVYPDGFATTVSVGGLTDVMEGQFRPGHFDGVATVCAKLFLQTAADRAYFGEKDYQQLLVVRRMARDLDIAVRIIGCPTVREDSGLALSSRNLRLTPAGLETAGKLHPAMLRVAQALSGGESLAPLEARARADLTEAGFDEIEYFDLRDAHTLELLDRPDRPARLFAAGWVDGVRLIDNIPATPV